MTVTKVVGLEVPSTIASACVVHLSNSVLPKIPWWPIAWWLQSMRISSDVLAERCKLPPECHAHCGSLFFVGRYDSGAVLFLSEKDRAIDGGSFSHHFTSQLQNCRIQIPKCLMTDNTRVVTPWDDIRLIVV